MVINGDVISETYYTDTKKYHKSLTACMSAEGMNAIPLN